MNDGAGPRKVFLVIQDVDGCQQMQEVKDIQVILGVF
jgi:hypothetical protein